MSRLDVRVVTRRTAVALLGATPWSRSVSAATVPFEGRLIEFDPAVPMWPVSLLDRRGRAALLAARPGRGTIVVLWASWCPACRKDLPTLALRRQAFARREIDLVAVNIEEAPLAVVLDRSAAIETGGLALYFDQGGAALAQPSPDGHRSAFQPFGMPLTFFGDRTGLIRGYVKGAVDWSDATVAPIADWL